MLSEFEDCSTIINENNAFLGNFSLLKEFQWQNKTVLSWANHPSIKTDLTRLKASGFMQALRISEQILKN